MNSALDIHFQNLDRSPAIETAVHERFDKLSQFVPKIVSCRVTIEAPHKHRRHGKLYAVKIDVRIPGSEIVASRDPSEHHAHEDVYVAIRDAFKAAQRQLQNHIRISRGKIKAHEAPPHGTISELHSDEGYGRILTPDGRDIYFHRNSVVDADFDRLVPGMEVRFSEESGDRGPQASTVHLIGKHHIAD